MSTFEIISASVWYLVSLIVIIVITTKARKKAKKSGLVRSNSHKVPSPQGKAQRVYAPPRRNLSGSVPASHKLNGQAVSKAGLLKIQSPVMMEDREHDWLAGQLKEEARVMRRGDLLDLGASHNAICDARAIKLMHMLQHDSGIDDGEI